MPPETAALPAGFVERVGLTPERKRDVAVFRERLAAVNQQVNLVGASTLDAFWTRHFVDSAQLLWFSPKTLTWADLGSGAGLPGLVLAILLNDRPGAHVHLIESMAKRCRFLTEVVDTLGLPATVHNVRAEELRLSVEVVTARACARLPRLLGFAEPYFDLGARAVFLKGAGLDTELAEARLRWRFEAETVTSLSDARGRLVFMRGLARVGGR